MFEAWIIIGFINIGILLSDNETKNKKWYDLLLAFIFVTILSPVFLGFLIGEYLEDD